MWLMTFLIFCCGNSATLKLREYSLINTTTCQYNTSDYQDIVHEVDVCTNETDYLDITYCSKTDNYIITNSYYGHECNSNTIYRSQYQSEGCIPSSNKYYEIIECDYIAPKDGLYQQIAPINNNQCSNYFHTNDDVTTDLRPIPFDTCFHLTKRSNWQYSYNYVCNNHTSVIRQEYSTFNCHGPINDTKIISAFNVHCGGSQCSTFQRRSYSESGGLQYKM